MPRIRTLKPEAPQHRKVGRLSIWARWLWVVMITQADDHGRLVADPGQLRVVAFGYDKAITDGRVMQCLEEIQATGMIRLYPVDGTLYADFPSWDDHQRISHPTNSKLPEYRDSGNFQNAPESSSTIKEGIKEGKGSERNGGEALAAPPREPSGIQFQIPESIQQALSRSPVLGAVARLQQPAWWQAQVRANGRRGVDFAAEVLNAEAWLATNPDRAPRKDHAGFLHRWFKRAEAPHA